MSTPILATKLYLPPPRPNVVLRPRLINRLNEGLHRKLTLISAPAGFGKTTLASEWVAGDKRPAAWLSLDKGDNDPIRFLTYLIAALQTLALSEVEEIAPRKPSVGHIGEGVLAVLQSPQPPPIESILTVLLNEIITIPDNFVLVLDDYHVIDAKSIDSTLTFLLEHLPPQMHLVITTREDPALPLARLRVRGQLTELRATDLRFTPDEAATFLNQVMDLNLSAAEIAALESRTEGWIAGLQLAALSLRGYLTLQETSSMPGHQNAATFIKSFTGSHRFVLDYLVEEVLHQQPNSIQTFLLNTSILERLCGPLCDAVLRTPSVSAQETLESIEQANLFIIPLDNERRWYRYHHLFAELLRQRLQQRIVSSTGDEQVGIAELHSRASHWYEENGLDFAAFHHAAAANDIERAAYLLAGKGMPLHFRGAVAPVLTWLASLPTAVLDARPTLWVMYASALSMTGQLSGVEPKLQAAEAALQAAEPNDKTRNLIGHIAAIHALLAASRHDVKAIIDQSNRALAYLHPDNLPVRTATTWKLGFAYQLQGDRAAAIQAYSEAIATSEASGNKIINIAATIALGNVEETENRLYRAAASYRRVLQLAEGQLQPAAGDAHLGLARLFYEWNDLEAAQQHAQQSIQLAQQIENVERVTAGELFLARLKVIQSNVDETAVMLDKVDQLVRQHNIVTQAPEVAAVQVLILLHRGDLGAAANLAKTQDLPLSLARVHLAQGDATTALAVLEPLRQRAEAKGFKDQRLKVMVLQAAAYYLHGEKVKAISVMNDALALTKPGGFIRLFVDEGIPMARLLYDALSHGIEPEYIRRLLAAFPETEPEPPPSSPLRSPESEWIETLSERELEVLLLIAEGLTNQEVANRLFLSLHTVKVHARNIYAKLGVKNRTQAVARGRAVGLLSRP